MTRRTGINSTGALHLARDKRGEKKRRVREEETRNKYSSESNSVIDELISNIVWCEDRCRLEIACDRDNGHDRCHGLSTFGEA